jgi:hypothetical protein
MYHRNSDALLYWSIFSSLISLAVIVALFRVATRRVSLRWLFAFTTFAAILLISGAVIIRWIASPK